MKHNIKPLIFTSSKNTLNFVNKLEPHLETHNKGVGNLCRNDQTSCLLKTYLTLLPKPLHKLNLRPLEATVLQEIHYWLVHNLGHCGTTYMFKSNKSWAELYSVHPNTIKNIFCKLKKLNLLTIKYRHYTDKDFKSVERRSYTINYDKLSRLLPDIKVNDINKLSPGEVLTIPVDRNESYYRIVQGPIIPVYPILLKCEFSFCEGLILQSIYYRMTTRIIQTDKLTISVRQLQWELGNYFNKTQIADTLKSLNKKRVLVISNPSKSKKLGARRTPSSYKIRVRILDNLIYKKLYAKDLLGKYIFYNNYLIKQYEENLIKLRGQKPDIKQENSMFTRGQKPDTKLPILVKGDFNNVNNNTMFIEENTMNKGEKSNMTKKGKSKGKTEGQKPDTYKVRSLKQVHNILYNVKNNNSNNSNNSKSSSIPSLELNNSVNALEDCTSKRRASGLNNLFPQKPVDLTGPVMAMSDRSRIGNKQFIQSNIDVRLKGVRDAEVLLQQASDSDSVVCFFNTVLLEYMPNCKIKILHKITNGAKELSEKNRDIIGKILYAYSEEAVKELALDYCEFYFGEHYDIMDSDFKKIFTWGVFINSYVLGEYEDYREKKKIIEVNKIKYAALSRETEEVPENSKLSKPPERKWDDFVINS